MRTADTTLICVDHKLPVETRADGLHCSMGHKVQRYRRLDRKTHALGPITRAVDPTSAQGREIAMEINRRTAPAVKSAPPAKPPVPPAAAPVAARPVEVPEDPRPRCTGCQAVLDAVAVQVGGGLCQPCEDKASVPVMPEPRSAAEILTGGIYTDVDLAELVNAVMNETLSGGLDPAKATVVLGGAGKLLRIAEARARRGSLPTYESNGALVLVGRRK
jgi:hypothetical protein